LLLWLFFLALPRVRFIIIINRTRGKNLLFLVLLSVFYRPGMVDFLIIFFISEQRIWLYSMFLEILHIQLRT
jgi:hypothetical protein